LTIGLSNPPKARFLAAVSARWRRRPTTVYRLLRYTFKVPTFRLTAKGHLYALRDIEAIEEKAKHNQPSVPTPRT